MLNTFGGATPPASNRKLQSDTASHVKVLNLIYLCSSCLSSGEYSIRVRSPLPVVLVCGLGLASCGLGLASCGLGLWSWSGFMWSWSVVLVWLDLFLSLLLTFTLTRSHFLGRTGTKHTALPRSLPRALTHQLTD